MHILVTGATGYVGGRLIPRLLERGHQVRVFVRDPRRIAGATLFLLLEAVEEGHTGLPPEELAVLADRFGIAMTSVLGRSYRAGDENTFTIQSISKPFVYAMVIDELGLEEVARNVGFEPSGEPFNAISLEPDTGRPDNAMINAGAIVIS